MRSDTVTKGMQQAPHRSLFNALGYTEEESVAICAYDLIKELEKLPKNKYIDIYIELLNNFI